MDFHLVTSVSIPFETILDTPTPSEIKNRPLLQTSSATHPAPVQAANNQEQKSESPSPIKKNFVHSVIFNISGTKYDVVRDVGKNMPQWQISVNPKIDWDVAWIDIAADLLKFAKLKPYQKVNFFSGINCLTRKDNLSKNLMQLRRKFPEHFDFFPETFILPDEFNQFKAQFKHLKEQNIFIVKPQASSQGRGIFLTKTFTNVPQSENTIAQRYLSRPYLLDGLKFDLRIYVLITSCDPLRLYIFEDGLARFATEPYQRPCSTNLSNTYMHLTNYAINKNNPDFVFNNSATDDATGHKRSLKALFKTLQEKGHDVSKLWEDIKKLVIKTFCSVQPILSHKYRSMKPEGSTSSVCFQVLGFDVMLDESLKPWLIEVNGSPSFSTDTPLDKSIKERVIGDALHILHLSPEDKFAYRRKQKYGAAIKNMTTKTAKDSKQEKEAEQKLAQKQHFEQEENNCRGYQIIFPPKDATAAVIEKYGIFMRVAKESWMSIGETPLKRNYKLPHEPQNTILTTLKNFSISRPQSKLSRGSQLEKKDKEQDESSMLVAENSMLQYRRENATQIRRPLSALEIHRELTETLEKAFETDRIEPSDKVLDATRDSIREVLETHKDTSAIFKERYIQERTSSCHTREVPEQILDPVNHQSSSKSGLHEEVSISPTPIKKSSQKNDSPKRNLRNSIADQQRFLDLLRRCSSASEERMKNGNANKKARVGQDEGVVKSCNTSNVSKRKNEPTLNIGTSSSTLFYASTLVPQKINLEKEKETKLNLPNKFIPYHTRKDSKKYISTASSPKIDNGSASLRTGIYTREMTSEGSYKELARQKEPKSSRDAKNLLFMPGATYQQGKPKYGNFLMPKLIETYGKLYKH